jgi:hypothetical protein
MSEENPSAGLSEEERRRRFWLEHALQTPPPRPMTPPQKNVKK